MSDGDSLLSCWSQGRALGILALTLTVALDLCGKYRDWWWYDNVAHLSAGVAFGSLLSTDESTTGQDLGVAVGLSVLWELGEYIADVRPWNDAHEREGDWAAEDTVLDTLLVLLGTWWAAGEGRRSGDD
ncbi:MAG: hypothetical protein ACI9CA_001691 [Natronomonas sp.]|jgi:hypothetical protein